MNWGTAMKARQIPILLCAATALLAATACGGKKKSYDELGSSGLTTRTENLQANLRTFADKGVMVGQVYGTLQGVGWRNDTTGRSDLHSICDDSPACSSYELAGIEQGAKANADGFAFADIRRDVLRLFRRGGLPLLMWSAPDHHGDEQLLDGWLERLADFLASLHDGYGIKAPVVLFLFPLDDGAYTTRLSPEAYRTLFAHSIDRLRDLGVTNAIYGVSCTDQTGAVGDHLPDGVDVANLRVIQSKDEHLGAETYARRLEQSLGRFLPVAQERNLAVGITAGQESLPSDTLFSAVLLPMLHKHRLSYLLLGQNRGEAKDGRYCVPFPGLDNARIGDFMRFYNDEATIFLNTLNGLYLKH